MQECDDLSQALIPIGDSQIPSWVEDSRVEMVVDPATSTVVQDYLASIDAAAKAKVANAKAGGEGDHEMAFFHVHICAYPVVCSHQDWD